MTEQTNSGRFRIHSVNSTDVIPFCKGTSPLSDIVKETLLDSLNQPVENPQPIYSHDGSKHHLDKSKRVIDGIELLATSCPNLTAKTRGNMLPQVNRDEFYSDSIRPVSIHLEVDKHNSDNGENCEDASGSTRKLARKDEVIVDTGPNGRFLKFSKEIGRGAFKTVYKGIDTETGVAIAWCEIHNRRCTRDETVRFKREVEILKKLQHPNILRFYDFFYSSNRRGFVLVTELMNAGTLRTYLSRFPSIPLRLIKNWCLQILRGLQFLHSREPSIIHRDLKCDNIFINGANGSVKIGDLGLAVLSNSNARTVIGTPEFMAPEMYEEDYDEAVDIWAFGLCVLEMYTLEYPYKECRSPAAIFKRVSEGIRPKALDIVEDQDLYNIIVCCTERDKNCRVTIPTLLNHEFFQEQEIHMEEVPPIGSDTLDPNNIKLVLSRDQKAITLDFNLEIDNPEKVVEELVTAGFVKHNEYAIFVKSLRNRIEKARRNKHLSPILNEEENSKYTIEKDCAIPVDVFHKVDICHQPNVIETDNIDFREHEYLRGNYNGLEIQSRFHSMASHNNLLSPTLSEKHLEELDHPNRNVRLTLTGITGDKLICFLISANTTLEFGFSLQEYSSNELVKNMIDNKFILASEQQQFKFQAEQLTKIVQAKKFENMDDASIVDYIKELPHCDYNYNVINEDLSTTRINSKGDSMRGTLNTLSCSDGLSSISINNSQMANQTVHNQMDSATQSTFSNFIPNAPICMPVVSFRTRSCIHTKGNSSFSGNSSNDTPRFLAKINNQTSKYASEICNSRPIERKDLDDLKIEQKHEISRDKNNPEVDFESGISSRLHCLSDKYSSQPSGICHNCRPYPISIPVSNNEPLVDTFLQKENVSNKHVSTHFNTPFTSANDNLSYNAFQSQHPLSTNSPLIDGRMSHILLLALYKGFQSPEFQEYMCTIEKKILLESQSLPKLTTSITDRPMQPIQLPTFPNYSDIFHDQVTGNYKNDENLRIKLSDQIEAYDTATSTKSKSIPSILDDSIHIVQSLPNILLQEESKNCNGDQKSTFEGFSDFCPNIDNSSGNYETLYDQSRYQSISPCDLTNDN